VEGTIYDITVDPGAPGGGDETQTPPTTISATGEHPFLVARAGPRAAALDTRADPEAVALVEPLDTRDRTGQDLAGQGRRVPASDLAEGDAVRTMSPQGVAGTATVTKIRGRHAVVPVYNLTVEGTSRYLVGACGVVVHNTNGCGIPSNARYAQTTYSARFSKGGRFEGMTVDSLAAALRSGSVSPAQVPVSYIIRGGQAIILNTRSAKALEAAGIPPLPVERRQPYGTSTLRAVAERAADAQSRRSGRCRPAEVTGSHAHNSSP
jgi:hypothetical protein